MGYYMSDLIYRQEAIDAVEKSRQLNHHIDRKTSCDHENEHRHFLTILNELPSADRWISCSEKLPEYGEAVLTINEDGDYEVNHIIDEDNGEWFYEGAIAWMTLPPYKE